MAKSNFITEKFSEEFNNHLFTVSD